jgi:hypothetical protein
MCPRTHSVHPSPTDFSRKQRAKSVPPETDRFMAYINTAFVQQIFHISKRKWITHIHHHRQADDFRRRLEVLEWVAFCHPVTLGVPPAHFNQVSSDSALLCGHSRLSLRLRQCLLECKYGLLPQNHYHEAITANTTVPFLTSFGCESSHRPAARPANRAQDRRNPLCYVMGA